MIRKRSRAINPFYVLLVVVGAAFAITACAYGWSARLKLDPRHFDQHIAFVEALDRWGVTVMIVELAILTVCTFLAIGTDEFWERRSGTSPPEGEPESGENPL